MAAPLEFERRKCEGCWEYFYPTHDRNTVCSPRCRMRLTRRRREPEKPADPELEAIGAALAIAVVDSER
jgi:hypothetical protein